MENCIKIRPFQAIFKHHGFTLIEMSIVMVIVGIVISTMTTVMPAILKTAKLKEGVARLNKYDNALQGYAIVNLRLPFPDTDGDGLENTGNTFSGTLPYRTLGLSHGTDVWNQPIKYAVYGSAGNPDSLTGNPVDKAALLAVMANIAAVGFSNSIAYTTSAATCVNATSANSSNQAYVIASGGPKNMDGINGLFDLCTGSAGVGFNADNRIQDPTYDDLVRSLSLAEFTQKVCSP